MRLQLHIHHFSLGQTPEPVELNWANAGLGWRFLDDHRVSLIGNLSLKEGQTIVSDSVGQYWIEIDTSSIEALGWGEVWVSGRLEQYSIGATIAYRIIEANSTSGD